MKKSSKILIGVIIVMVFIVGYFLGITINFPKTDNKELSGTIGRMNNYRNVKVTENDIKLRSDLQSNEALLKGYLQFYSFHYSTTAKLCDDIGFAIQTSESISEFSAGYQAEIDRVNQFLINLEQARKDILLALTSLQNINNTNGNNIGLLINNANIAIAQAKYKQVDLTNFIEAVEVFLAANNSGDFSDLKKAHDLLAMNQIIIAAVTNDKPMLKYLDKKAFLSGSEQLQIIVDKERLNEIIKSDFDGLKILLSENKELGIIYSSEVIGSIEKQLNAFFLNIEKLGIVVLNSSKLDAISNNENLNAISNREKIGFVAKEEKLGAGKEEKIGIVGKNENLGIIFNAEKLGCCILILDTEKLGRILNAEKLGFLSNENLGLLDFEKLTALDKEQLNID